MSKPGPKMPRKPPAWSLQTTIEELHRLLDCQPAAVSVAAGRAALQHLERMRTIEAELYRLRDEHATWREVVQDYNALWYATNKRGIEVFQPAGSDDWHWTNGEYRGSAPTSGEALLEALAAA